MPTRADKEAMRVQSERDEAESTLYGSPRTPSYKDNSAAMIRLSILGLAAVAVGGAVAYGAFDAPSAQAPLGAESAQTTPAPPAQTQQMAALESRPEQPQLGPAATVPPVAAKPRPAAPPAATAPAEAPVPAPLAEKAPPIDVDPATPEVLPAPPEVIAPAPD